jgi:BirA family transcriptional regulator, biotin operon repressor / biotin---[acetyl-CoA-carboxylase] ligase
MVALLLLVWVNLVPVRTDEPSRPPLDPLALRAALTGPGSMWRTVEVLAAAPSTNRLVADRARAGAAGGLVVVTEHQTAGRGRLDRVWVTPARAALTFSFLLTPRDLPSDRWTWLPLLAGLAVRDGVRRAGGPACTLKWPNDVLVGDAKVAGILVERVDRPAGATAVVVGVGVNVSTTRDELPVPTATSLALEDAGHVDRGNLLVAVLGAFAAGYAGWVAAGEDGVRALRAAYLDACDTIGRPVTVAIPGGQELAGEAVGVDEHGRLRVATADGVRVLGAGDVVHVRRR